MYFLKVLQTKVEVLLPSSRFRSGSLSRASRSGFELPARLFKQRLTSRQVLILAAGIIFGLIGLRLRSTSPAIVVVAT